MNDKQPTDRGTPIPASRLLNNGRQCSFCEGPEHYGFCDQMRAYNDEQTKTLSPHVTPLVRHG